MRVDGRCPCCSRGKRDGHSKFKSTSLRALAYDWLTSYVRIGLEIEPQVDITLPISNTGSIDVGQFYLV